MKRLMKLQLP